MKLNQRLCVNKHLEVLSYSLGHLVFQILQGGLDFQANPNNMREQSKLHHQSISVMQVED